MQRQEFSIEDISSGRTMTLSDLSTLDAHVFECNKVRSQTNPSSLQHQIPSHPPPHTHTHTLYHSPSRISLSRRTQRFAEKTKRTFLGCAQFGARTPPPARAAVFHTRHPLLLLSHRATLSCGEKEGRVHDSRGPWWCTYGSLVVLSRAPLRPPERTTRTPPLSPSHPKKKQMDTRQPTPLILFSHPSLHSPLSDVNRRTRMLLCERLARRSTLAAYWCRTSSS